MRKTVCCLLLTSCAYADVSLFSTLPGGATIRYGKPGGEMREASVGSMESTSLSISDPTFEITVQDDKDLKVYQGTATNNRYLVLGPGKNGQAAVSEAGLLNDQGRTPLKAVGFFNATGYPISVSLYALSGEETLLDVKLPAHEAAGPFELDDATYKVFLHDEGGNPIGQAYSYARPGRYFLIFRKRGTLFDLEKLGSVVSKK